MAVIHTLRISGTGFARSDCPPLITPRSMSRRLAGANPETMAAFSRHALESSSRHRLDDPLLQQLAGYFDHAVNLLARTIDSARGGISQSLSALPELRLDACAASLARQPADTPFFTSRSTRRAASLNCNDYAETLVAQQISMVDGVAQVQVYGAQKYAVRAQLDPDALASRGIGVDDVASAITNGNPNTPVGSLYGKNINLTLQTNGQLTTAADYRPLIVAYRNGAPVRLRDGNVMTA